MRVLPPAPVRISASSPLRWLSLSTTTPANSSSTSIVTSSIGSSRWPPSSRKSTRGRRDRELEALAAHVLDQHAHLQLAAAGDLEGLAGGGVADPDRDVRSRPRASAARGSPGSAPCRRRARPAGESLMPKVTLIVGGSIGCAGSAAVTREVGDGVGDRGLGHAGEADDVAGLGLVDRRCGRGRGRPGPGRRGSARSRRRRGRGRGRSGRSGPCPARCGRSAGGRGTGRRRAWSPAWRRARRGAATCAGAGTWSRISW